jgi:uncharacterized LabA/DUF88 family protein
MSRLACYIDGFNLYHAIQALARPELKWVNLRALARSYATAADDVVSVVYFTAILQWDQDKARRHREYIKALEASDVEVVQSRFQKVPKYCRLNARYCHFYEEKQTDVAFALRVFSDAIGDVANRVILVTADNDQIPLVKSVRAACPHLSVEVAAPPGRRQHARQLCSVATRHGEISEGRLRTCLLPREVMGANARVVARCPAKYLPAGEGGLKLQAANG